jgi:benzoyl-CoA reductase subunit C
VEFAKGWRAAGAIVVQQKSCTSHAADIPAIQKALEAEGVPSLVLESDVTVPVGQLRVRVEAFLEMLSDEGLFS